MRVLSFLLFIALSSVSVGILANAQQNHHEAGPQAPGAPDWLKGNKVLVNVTSGSKESDLTFSVEINENDDARAEITGRESGRRVAGTIMVVGGRVMCTRGLELEKGYEIDELDSITLTMQMALNLLSRAFPQGSGSVGSTTSIDLVERVRPLALNTRSASGSTPVPWNLRGSATHMEGQKVGFRLSFSYPSEQGGSRRETIQLAGTWEIAPTALVLDDSIQLRGWQIYSLGPVTSRTGEATVLDYAAVRMRDFDTLKELRLAMPHRAASISLLQCATREIECRDAINERLS